MEQKKINNLASSLRLSDTFVFLALLLLIFAIIDICLNSAPPNGNFTTMEYSDFREGDVISGTAVENFGNAITQTTTEYNYGFKGNTYDSAQYYLLPYYDNNDDVVPRKILLIKTGNKEQIKQLEALTDATYYFYTGEKSSIGMSVDIDRAVVKKLDKEEKIYVESFMKEYIEWFYQNSGFDTNKVYRAYMDVFVPYVIEYRLASDGTIFIIAGIFIVFAVLLTIIAFNQYKKIYSDYPEISKIKFPTFGLSSFITKRYAENHPMPDYVPPTPEEANSMPANDNSYNKDE